MSKVSNQLVQRRQGLYKKAYAVMVLIVAVGMGWYTYNNWNKYQNLQRSLAQNEARAEEIEAEVVDESANFTAKKPEFDATNKEIEKNLESIFPSDDAYTTLVRQMDAFEEELSTRSNIFEVSSIDFQEPLKEDEYSVLPVRMSIRSTAYNFTQFLHMIEASGSLDNEIRLMDISSIRLNFENSDAKDPKDKLINFTVQINAYFQ